MNLKEFIASERIAAQQSEPVPGTAVALSLDRLEAWVNKFGHGVTGEPIIHSHISDVLDNEHPLAYETVCCAKCGEMVHAFNNECMQTWCEISKVPFCISCALPCFKPVFSIGPVHQYIELQ